MVICAEWIHTLTNQQMVAVSQSGLTGMTMKKSLFAVLLAGIAFTSSTMAATQVRLGVNPGYAPFEYKKPDGSLAGFDIDLGKEICKRMDADCTWVESDFDGLIPALKAKKMDAILSSMSITPARQKQINFSDKLYGTPARLINELVKIDLIERQQNPNDKRQFWLSLTPLGFATFTQISDIRQALSQQALNHLTQEEQSLATEVIISMSNNLKSV